MRLLVHDYSGHPFQVQLSRSLAARGHDVLHVYCSSYQTGRGAVTPRPGDAATLRIESIDLGRNFDRYTMRRRVQQELAYGALFTRSAAAFEPDAILSSNDPLFAKARAARWCRRNHVPWVFWLQDVYSFAMSAYAKSRLGLAGDALGRGFQAVERRLAHDAAEVIAITDDFRPTLRSWGLPDERIHVIENWAPLDELDEGTKNNPWSRRHALHDRPVLLYSGTLGLKHDPSLLADLAARLGERAAVVVISEGKGAEWLADAKAERSLDNLLLLPYQPFEDLPDVLASADVLLALLDPGAGIFSAPSKILTYLCAGRPVLAAMPADNLGARTIERAGAGVVVAPGDREAWLVAAEDLMADDRRRATLGTGARRHAEHAFDIETITDRFEDILTSVARPPVGGSQLSGR